ncbi:MAG: hypothetical protein IJI54_02490 [Kiritimatiellae bacterium]|nr:hypothetical protein [Kiritimatiellia bacterium]
MRCLEKVKANSVWHDANPDLLLPKCRGRHVAIAGGRGLGGFGDFDEVVDATLAEGRFDEGEVASAAMPRRGSLHCGISRRFFIGGAAAFGAFGGNRVVRAAGNALAGGPNVTFGVVSDIHVTKVGKARRWRRGATTSRSGTRSSGSATRAWTPC